MDRYDRRKMTEKQKFFIYGRQEMKILITLGVLITFFAFTLGIHLGKRIGPKGMVSAPKDPTTVKTLSDVIPDRNEIIEQSKNANEVADEEIDKALKEEVDRAAIRLEKPRQVELPHTVKAQTVK